MGNFARLTMVASVQEEAGAAGMPRLTFVSLPTGRIILKRPIGRKWDSAQ
jgi:hypothetical protein